MPLLLTSPTLTQPSPQEEGNLLSHIRDVITPSCVYLLTVSRQRRTTESIFQQDMPDVFLEARYHVLVLITNRDNRPCHEWQDRIEQRCADIASVTAIVLEVSTLSNWAASNHPFARRVLETAPVIYSSADIQFDLPGEFADDEASASRDRSYRNGRKTAREFLAGAELFSLRNQPKLAAYMLNQAAEQALFTLITYCTGYCERTHSLDKLLRYAAMVSSEIHKIFPRHTDKDKKLFSVLQHAYIGARYDKDYSVHLANLNIMIEKVKKVIELLVAGK